MVENRLSELGVEEENKFDDERVSRDSHLTQKIDPNGKQLVVKGHLLKQNWYGNK